MVREIVERRSAITFSIVTVALLLFPIRHNWLAQPKDGFPLSYYPMFTSTRGEITTLHHVVGITHNGESVNVPGKYAGPGGMNTVRRQMRKMYHGGQAAELAKRVAERLNGSSFTERHKVVRVEVVKSNYTIKRYFDGETGPVSREVAASVKLAKRPAP